MTTVIDSIDSVINLIDSNINMASDEKSDGKEDTITLYYWNHKNRGNSIRLPLVAAGIKFEEISDGKIVNDKCHCYSSKKKLDQVNQIGLYDPFAPPYIDINGKIFMSQTVAIQQYIGEIGGLCPKSALDKSLSLMILNNINDIQSELWYHRNDSTKELKEWLEGRFAKWMHILNKPLTKSENNKAKNYYFENRMTLADLGLANLLDAFHEIFDKSYNKIIGEKYPAMEALYQRIVKASPIKEFLEKQMKNGVFWYIDEYKGIHDSAANI